MNAYALRLPDPRRIVDTLGPQPVDSRVLEYLRSGLEACAYLGYSYCRFHCGTSDHEMGCRDLTDGIWVWPEGLPHYVEIHRVPLPGEVVETMKRNEWQIPVVRNLDQLEDAQRDDSFWLSWYEGIAAG